MKDSAVIIMAKAPKVGHTKSRLTPPLSSAYATQLYEALLRDTITLVSGIEEVNLAIAVSPPESIDYFESICPKDTLLLPVVCKDIGDCQKNVLGTLLEQGYRKVFALNADSPTLPPAYIEEAVQRLDKDDIVFGPALDGGYYLVGLKQLYEEIFLGINWSTDTVLAETLSIINRMGKKVSLLPPWYDIDTVENIARLKNDLKSLPVDELIYTRKVLGAGDSE